MSPEKLQRMANQIATFFESQKDTDQPQAVATHINQFWEPRMRRQMFEMVEGGQSAGFHPLFLQAVQHISRPGV